MKTLADSGLSLKTEILEEIYTLRERAMLWLSILSHEILIIILFILFYFCPRHERGHMRGEWSNLIFNLLLIIIYKVDWIIGTARCNGKLYYKNIKGIFFFSVWNWNIINEKETFASCITNTVCVCVCYELTDVKLKPSCD